MKLAINSWRHQLLSCSTSPIDNVHIPLYYEYLKPFPVVFRLYNHFSAFSAIFSFFNQWNWPSTEQVITFSVSQPFLLTTLTSRNHQISYNLLHMAIYKSHPLSNILSSINQSYVQVTLTLTVNRINIHEYFECYSWHDTPPSGGHHIHIDISGFSSQCSLSHSKTQGVHPALNFINI